MTIFSLVLSIALLVFIIFANVQSSAISPVQEEIQPKQFRFPKFVTYYEWKKIEFNFKDKSLEKKLIEEKKLIQKNLAVSAAKIYDKRVFISTPRFTETGTPVTLSTVPFEKDIIQAYFNQKKSPKFTPFPNYEMQEEGNCSAFQFVQSMEIDQFGRLWVVDTGRTNFLSDTPTNRCPAKLVVFDLKNKDKMLFTYTFPDDVVSPTGNGLKDISIGCKDKDDCWVYISDIYDSKIVVYNSAKNESWSASHPFMDADKTTQNFTINGVKMSTPAGITGNALSPKSRKYDTLYFGSISSTHLFMIETKTLQNPKLRENGTLKESDVKDLGVKEGQSDGIVMSSDSTLFYGSLPQNAVYSTDLKKGTNKLGESKEVAKDDEKISWPDTFGFDGKGNLAVTTTKFQLYEKGELEDTDVRYRLLLFPVRKYDYNRDK